MLYPQAPNAVVMVRPHFFSPNPQTAQDNTFQQTIVESLQEDVNKQAYEEVTQVVDELKKLGVKVFLFEDATRETPDSVFPNNWFSTHAGGYVGVYPMYPENRRLERRDDVLKLLKQEFRVQEVVDYSGLEMDHIYLEGTGSMVLDHIERIAYATSSFRTSPVALERFCAHFNYEPMLFEAKDSSGNLIYHTNVMMCLGSDYVLICDEMISDTDRRQEVITRLRASGRTVIKLSEQQINGFCGNALELHGKQGRFLAMSATSQKLLNQLQLEQIQSKLPIEFFNVSTIELAGGSIRCMLASIHLSQR